MNTPDTTRRIRISYALYTPESIANGDAEEHGWIDKEGVPIELDEFAIEDGLTITDVAARYLYDEWAIEPSGDPWHPGVWYIARRTEKLLAADCYTDYHYHLVGFTEEEERQIFEKLQQMLYPRRHRGRSPS